MQGWESLLSKANSNIKSSSKASIFIGLWLQGGGWARPQVMPNLLLTATTTALAAKVPTMTMTLISISPVRPSSSTLPMLLLLLLLEEDVGGSAKGRGQQGCCCSYQLLMKTLLPMIRPLFLEMFR